VALVISLPRLFLATAFAISVTDSFQGAGYTLGHEPLLGRTICNERFFFSFSDAVPKQDIQNKTPIYSTRIVDALDLVQRASYLKARSH
jgi:hypothetical protein